MKHIDKVFRDKLYNQKTTVPDGMWEKIAPALEENSGRSILWFWFAGILTLIIGGLAYLFLTNNHDANSSTSPLAYEMPTKEIQIPAPAPHTLSYSDNLTNSSTNESDKNKIDKTIAVSPKLKKNNSAQQKNSTIAHTKTTIESASVEDKTVKVNNKVNTDDLYAKPANLVITKSYISNNGSIIEKSNLSKDTKSSAPIYNVFINSEGLNAGALLRIIEPLENIPLPAFSTVLKKKITL
ncbi:MAG: hypothetical protein ACJA1A_001917 [Saprospiraceae bacterium]|jgi:hypothetical protein|tara:strand:+ start:1071 stop:1787 length:717 start_codon:yes stop_codon:yes gene_type:complete